MEQNTYIASKKNGNSFFKSRFTYIASNSPHIDVTGNDVKIPLYIFRNGLSGLEAISKYLHEVNGLRYCEIAKLLARDDRTVWDAYNSAQEKSNSEFIDEETQYFIPVSIFQNRVFSVLESLTIYLKENCGLRYCKIATLLGKDQRTVWTVYQRVLKKRKKCFA